MKVLLMAAQPGQKQEMKEEPMEHKHWMQLLHNLHHSLETNVPKKFQIIYHKLKIQLLATTAIFLQSGKNGQAPVKAEKDGIQNVIHKP